MIVILPAVCRAGIVNGTVEGWVGYDSNPSLLSKPESSAFALCKLMLFREFKFDSPSMDGSLYLEGQFKNYFEMKDNYLISAGGNLSFPNSGSRWLPFLFADISTYIDKEKEEDESNNLSAGAGFDWIANSRLTLGAKYAATFKDYKEKAIIEVVVPPEFHNPTPSNPGNPTSPGNAGQQQQQQPQIITQAISRDDQIHTGTVHGTFYFSPEFSGDLAFEIERCDSSIDEESNDRTGAILTFSWSPSPDWETECRLSWEHIGYDKSDPDMKREDSIWGIGIEIIRYFEQTGLFVKFNRSENNGSPDLESYDQTVTQCGIIWSF
ncbi:hypothetical protein QUF76_18470 [Desulfobacterales bacterium HSG16]|nr:hypothetical protein [Desulfobacterales bacterium HSG16]